MPHSVSAIGLALMAWLLFAALDTAAVPVVLVALCLGQIAVNGMVVSSVPIYVLLFRPEDRVTGAGVSFKTSDAVLGGTTPLLAGLLVRGTGSGWAVALYVTVLVLIALTASVVGRRLLAERTGRPAPEPVEVDA